MTTYGEGGPVLFRIAHQNIAQDISYKCDHWVLIYLGLTAQKETSLRKEIEERCNGKNKPIVALGNVTVCRPIGGGRGTVKPKNGKHKEDFQTLRQRRNAIERHNRNAV